MTGCSKACSLEEPTAAEVWASRQYLNTTIDSLGFVGDMSLAHTEAKQGYPYNKGTLVVSSLPLENLKLTIRVLSPKQSVIWFTMGYLLVLTLVLLCSFSLGSSFIIASSGIDKSNAFSKKQIRNWNIR